MQIQATNARFLDVIACRKSCAFPEVTAMSIADEESFAIEKVARGQESIYPASPRFMPDGLIVGASTR